MPKFIKKPVVIEAIQWTGKNKMEILNFLADNGVYSNMGGMRILTSAGTMHCTEGDWIIRGVRGEFNPCKPDIFLETYEEVKEDG